MQTKSNFQLIAYMTIYTDRKAERRTDILSNPNDILA